MQVLDNLKSGFSYLELDCRIMCKRRAQKQFDTKARPDATAAARGVYPYLGDCKQRFLTIRVLPGHVEFIKSTLVFVLFFAGVRAFQSFSVYEV